MPKPKCKMLFKLFIFKRGPLLALSISLLFAFGGNVAVAEATASPESNSPEAVQKRLYALQQQARSALAEKMQREKDDWAEVTVLSPINFSQLKTTDFLKPVVEETLHAFSEDITIKQNSYVPQGISLDMLRLAVAKTDADLLVATVILPGNIDFYIYDKRDPYRVFAQSENFAEGKQEDLRPEMARFYAKQGFRRALFRYISNQAYDLPRDGSPPVLQSEVPRFIASYQAVEMVNREVYSNFYASVNWGGAMSRGQSGKLWNSSLISIEVGANILGRFYLEAAGEVSAYNTAIGSLKYLISDREEAIRLMFGLGGAILSNRHTFDWDQSNDITGRQYYAVPSVSIMFPISDVFLKLESRMLVGLTHNSQIFTFMPGIHLWF